jgi:hypothetical protein
MTPRLDRFGDPVEDDDQPVDNNPVRPTRRTRDEIHHDRCAQLRAIIRAAKARREAQE